MAPGHSKFKKCGQSNNNTGQPHLHIYYLKYWNNVLMLTYLMKEGVVHGSNIIGTVH